MPTEAIVLFSGGLDSLACLIWAVERFDKVTPLFINYGGRYHYKDLLAADAICARMGLTLVERACYLGDKEDQNSWLPLRNLIFLQLATYYGTTIVFGAIANEGSPDKQPSFFRKMEVLIKEQYRGREFRLFTPFIHETKTSVLRFIMNSAYTGLLPLTVGCYSASNKSCGQCYSCFNRWVAFALGGHTTLAFDYKPFYWQLKNIAQRKKGSDFSLWKKRAQTIEFLQAIHIRNQARKALGLPMGGYRMLWEAIQGRIPIEVQLYDQKRNPK